MTHALARSKLWSMERNLNDVFQEAVQLPEGGRATLAGLLIETLDPVSEPDIEAAWSEEIERRLSEIDAGIVELISWDDVRSELFDESAWRESGIRI
jgi:putative addiction module component (TIGR02574 family)